MDIFRIVSISKSFSGYFHYAMVEKKNYLLTTMSDLIGFKVRNPQYPDVVITLKMIYLILPV